MTAIWAVLAFFVLFLFIRKFFRPLGDLKKIPGPLNVPTIGCLKVHWINERTIIPFVRQWVEEYGGLFILWVGWIGIVNIATAVPAENILSNKQNIRKGRSYKMLYPWLGRGLLTSEGSRWWSHRRLITPTFHFSILETFIEIFSSNSKILVQLLAEAHETPVAINPYISRCTLDIISEAAMGTKINAQIQAGKGNTETSQYISSVLKLSQLTTKRMLNFLVRFNPLYMITSSGREYLKHLQIVHNFTENVIFERKQVPKNKKDQSRRLAFLDLLLEAVDEDGNPFSDQDIREEVDTFMFEGHDTTATAIIWILYLLAKHPTIQQQVRLELIQVFGNELKRTPSLADLSELKCLERCIKEALRLYPSVPNVTRYIEHDMEIGGYKVPRHSAVVVHIYQLHRDPTVFPDPEKFDPDRFLPENIADRHPFAYVPFSAGPRNCIGQKFAMLEEKVILSSLILAYNISFIGSVEEKDLRCELILRPPSNMRFQFKKRHL